MMCYIKIKLAKSLQETAKTVQAPETEKKCTIPRLPSKPTQTRNVLFQNQRRRKPSPVRRSPRKKKAAISLVEDAPVVQSSDASEVHSADAPDVQSSESEFSHIKTLLSAPVTSCHEVKGNMATANISAENTSITKIAPTELSGMPETSSSTVDNDRQEDPVQVEAISVPDVKGEEVLYASNVLQHFVSCAPRMSHCILTTVR